MIFDAEHRTEDRFKHQRYDVCVIGGGPAGITLARRLAALGRSVGLFEGGGLEASSESQQLYQGRVGPGRPYFPLDGTRLRYLGGSSNHWGGWTRPLDAHDFVARPDHALSGWPISKLDLDPYAAETDSILDLPPNFEPPDMFSGQADGVTPDFFRFSHPVTRFGTKYRGELQSSKLIELFVNANLVDFELDAHHRRIEYAVFRSYRRPQSFQVRAQYFALCLGGIENPRLLLNATRQLPRGLGNEHDLVGRYFLEHPHVPVGRVVTREPITFMLVYSPSRDFMQSHQILSFGLRLGNFDLSDGAGFTGAFRPQPSCAMTFEDLLATEMRGEKTDCLAHVGDAFVACEQALNPDSRVLLTEQRDRFGLRRAQLDWRLSEIDFRTIRTATMKIGRLLAGIDVGRLKVVEWLLGGEEPELSQLFGGNHHMGTTRMSDDPGTGVVDRNVRVHALQNLYLGGSSVFATSGHSNPTYTIVQLALRLGDHLAQRLSYPGTDR
jgi:choline dehydrogenase-like flavoprotein